MFVQLVSINSNSRKKKSIWTKIVIATVFISSSLSFISNGKRFLFLIDLIQRFIPIHVSFTLVTYTIWFYFILILVAYHQKIYYPCRNHQWHFIVSNIQSSYHQHHQITTQISMESKLIWLLTFLTILHANHVCHGQQPNGKLNRLWL